MRMCMGLQVILDARTVGSAAPLCTIRLPVRSPFTFHGAFTPMTYGVGGQGSCEADETKVEPCTGPVSGREV